jgi:competence protein ComEA
VHVVGQVKRAGLYVLDSGARVADAILAADGFTRFADEASVNLARLLSDGEQIAVARQSSDGSASQTMTNESTPLINLNRATEQQIEGLPGVGPTLAGRIVDWRIANGGFKTKADLQKVSGIGEKLFAQLKDLVSL